MRSPFASLFMAGLVLGGFPAAAGAQNNPAGTERTTQDGVFSAAQAQRGRSVFANTCSQCHSRSQFAGDAGFQRNWEGRTFYDVFDQLRTTMPQDNPGAMSRRDYVDVLVYLLSENGSPKGDEELSAEDASLKVVRIVPVPGKGGGPPAGGRRRP